MMNCKPMIAAILAVVLPAKSLLAWAMIPAISAPHLCAVEARLVVATRPAPAFMPIAIATIPVAGSNAGAATSERQREVVMSLLLEAGCNQAEAQRQCGALTADDLAVLAANPRMVQKAGEMDELTKNLIWALVIAGVVVAIVIAADGSININ